MSDIATKRYLTTGDISKLCGVNFRTVIRWIRAHKLKAYQLPGTRGDNRVLVKDFITFLTKNDIPIPEELQPPAHRILIVEDDERMAKAMQRALRRAGFETMLATDGFLAGMLATTFKPFVITLDLKMPGLGGVQLLKAIRDLPAMATTKILIVSAMPQDQLDEALKAGADDTLEKPFENKDLVQKVAELAGVEPATAKRSPGGEE